MGCGSSKSLPYENDYSDFQGNSIPPSRPPVASKSRTRVSVGRPVGGHPQSGDKRAAQLAAAEKRAIDSANRGLKSPNKAVELNESAKRQELLGRINAHYGSINKDPPMGLNLASLDQLRNHYDAIRKATSLPTYDSVE